jgi:tyrosyl-tRNA synthetase
VIQQSGLQLNGQVLSEDKPISEITKIFGKYVILQAGKKNFALIMI